MSWVDHLMLVEAANRSVALTGGACSAFADRPLVRVLDLGQGLGPLLALAHRLEGTIEVQLAGDRFARLQTLGIEQGWPVQGPHVGRLLVVEQLAEVDLLITNHRLHTMDWDGLQDLADLATQHGAVLWSSTTPDGRFTFEPRETRDARLVDTLVKGWAQKGPGIDASETLAGLLTEHTIAEESVTWMMGPDEPEMLKRTVEYLATMALGEGAWVQRWARDRLAQVQADMLEITLGFGDLLARPR